MRRKAAIIEIPDDIHYIYGKFIKFVEDEDPKPFTFNLKIKMKND